MKIYKLIKKPRVKKTFKDDDEFYQYTEKWRKYYEGDAYKPVEEEDTYDEEEPAIFGKLPSPAATRKKNKKLTEQLVKKYKDNPNVEIWTNDSDEDRSNTTNS